MRSFKEQLVESTKKYDFRIKIAGDVSADRQKQLESLLDKYKVSSFKKAGTTPVQKFPLDFPKITNEQVNIFEVTLDYPTTQFELSNYLVSNLKIASESIVVRRPGEPLEEYQVETEKRKEALLNDSEYKEAPNSNIDDFFGEKYNTSFLKELNDVLKLQRKERGEVIPTEGVGKTTNDLPQNNKSPLQQAKDPRK